MGGKVTPEPQVCSRACWAKLTDHRTPARVAGSRVSRLGTMTKDSQMPTWVMFMPAGTHAHAQCTGNRLSEVSGRLEWHEDGLQPLQTAACCLLTICIHAIA